MYRTRDHPAFVERFIRTFKDIIFKRVENDERKGKNNIQWTDYIFQIMITYNTKNVHSATGQTPLEATKKGNEFKSKLNVSIQAKRRRTYPELEVGDKVNIEEETNYREGTDKPPFESEFHYEKDSHETWAEIL